MAAPITRLLETPPKDAKTRREVCDAARQLYLALETPIETMHRLFLSPLLLPVVQVGVDMKLFRNLSDGSHQSWTVQSLAETLSVDQTLLNRVLRYQAAFGLVSQPEADTYSPNDATRWLATPGAEAGTKHFRTTISKAISALPDFLAKTAYQNPSDPTKCAFNLAFGTKSPAYAWRPEDMSILMAFIEFMKSQRATQRSWMETFPRELMASGAADEERALFVDVGGATGHQCITLRQQWPELKGRVVVQDQQDMIARLDRTSIDGLKIEAQVHDFFGPQPVKEAKAYYMRNIMHDWPDHLCIRILQHLKDVMAPDSMVLIDETVLADSHPNWKQVQKDIHMMASLGAMERNRSQFETLLAQVGLKIDSIFEYDESMGDAVIVAVLAK